MEADGQVLAKDCDPIGKRRSINQPCAAFPRAYIKASSTYSSELQTITLRVDGSYPSYSQSTCALSVFLNLTMDPNPA